MRVGRNQVAGAWLVLAWLLPSQARAQAAVAPEKPALPVAQPPTPDALPSPPPLPEAPAAQASEPAPPRSCVPRCRTGFVCLEGACVSACNPACPGGSTCTDAGECKAETPLSVAEEPSASTKDESVRNHDGLYLRLALGIGYMAASRRHNDLLVIANNFERVELTTELSGFAQVGAFMIGGTPAKGLVVGGGVWGANVAAPALSGDVADGNEIASVEVDTDMLSISLIGPFLAWYPDPRRGLHGELGFGYSFATSGDEASSEGVSLSSWDAAGWGFVGGIGYDFWVGSEWSFGVLARASFVQAGDDEQTFKAWVPALAATATFH